MSMSVQELELALIHSPDYINKLRKKLNKHPVMQILKHRSEIFDKLDVINIHLVTQFSALKDREAALIPYENITNNTRYVESYTVSKSSEIMRQYTGMDRELIVSHEIFVNARKFDNLIPSIFSMLSKESLIILDITNFFNRSDIHLLNKKTGETWSWSRYEFFRYKGFMSTPIYLKLYQLVFIVVALVVLSFATSLYTKIVTLLSPLILYALGKILKLLTL